MLSNICPGMILCNCRYKYAHRLNEKRFWGKKYATANYTRLQINFEKMKRGAIPQYDGKHYPYLQLEHLNNEFYRLGDASNANVSTPACYALIHPFLDHQTKHHQALTDNIQFWILNCKCQHLNCIGHNNRIIPWLWTTLKPDLIHYQHKAMQEIENYSSYNTYPMVKSTHHQRQGFKIRCTNTTSAATLISWF